MATTHQLKRGMFHVQWTPKEVTQYSDDCEMERSSITVSIKYDEKTSLFDVSYRCFDGSLRVGVTAKPGAHCPENVSAILRDEYKELDELIPGYWDYHWTYKRKPGSCFCWQKPTLVLILDFQSSAEEQTLNRMSRLLDAQSMADIKFIVRGENINAHLAVMASASPVIEAMFQGNRFKEGTTKTVQITDISPEAFKHLLQFVYSGKIPLLADSTETMEMLFFAADKYEIQELKDICEKSLARQVCKRNAIHLLIVAHLHSASKLQAAALQCIHKNRHFIWGTTEWQDLLTKHPTLFFIASKKMALQT